MNRSGIKKKRFERRKLRIKKKIRATRKYLRLCISRSNKNFYAQIIDDDKAGTVLGFSTLSKEFPKTKSRCNISAAKELGKIVAKKAIEKGITQVVFDRNGYLYHGKIRAFADAVRENGLKI